MNAPLYYNERHDFWGVSRYADVDAALKDPHRLSSAKGDILEVVKTDPVMPPGVFINEDPPLHTIHRALVSRAFTPKKMRALEDKVRAFCVACLDPLVGGERFDFVQDLGARATHADHRHARRHPRCRPAVGARAGQSRAAQQARRAAAGQEGPLLRRRYVHRVRRMAREESVRRPHHRTAQRRVRGRDRTLRADSRRRNC